MRRFPPERIVCLTEETVETLYLLGAEDRIVGVDERHERPRHGEELRGQARELVEAVRVLR